MLGGYNLFAIQYNKQTEEIIELQKIFINLFLYYQQKKGIVIKILLRHFFDRAVRFHFLLKLKLYFFAHFTKSSQISFLLVVPPKNPSINKKIYVGYINTLFIIFFNNIFLSSYTFYNTNFFTLRYRKIILESFQLYWKKLLEYMIFYINFLHSFI